MATVPGYLSYRNIFSERIWASESLIAPPAPRITCMLVYFMVVGKISGENLPQYNKQITV
jgi:hypothetical protein